MGGSFQICIKYSTSLNNSNNNIYYYKIIRFILQESDFN